MRRKWGPGNPLWEWKQKHKKGQRAGHKRVRHGVTPRTRRRKRVLTMARRHHSRRSGFGGGMGLAKKALIGFGAAALVGPGIIGGLGGLVLGGPASAVAGFVGPQGIVNMIGGGMQQVGIKPFGAS